MVGSDKTDVSIGAVNILHEGPEEYNNIWQKVRSMWSYIYDHYYDKYDWFHIGGDDLYLIPENLRLYLESEEIVGSICLMELKRHKCHCSWAVALLTRVTWRTFSTQEVPGTL